MGKNSGKFFDVKATTAFFNDVESSFSDYSQNSSLVQSSLNNFSLSSSWRGKDATSGKAAINSTQNKILGDIGNTHTMSSNLFDSILEKFRLEVDSASDARIDYDTLETINNHFQGFFLDFDENAKSAAARASSVISKYSKYGAITQPDFSGGDSSYKGLCGGSEAKSGYIHECMQKLVSFDADVMDMIAQSGLKTKVGSLKVNMTTRTLSCQTCAGALPPNEMELFADMFKKGMNGIGDWFKGFIPKNASNEDVIAFFEYLRYNRWVVSPFISVIPPAFATTINQSTIDKHYEANKKYLESGKVYTPGKYIENQSEWDDVYFGLGKSNMHYSGCEVIATINAMTYLNGGVPADMAAGIIKQYEEDGIAWNGQFGTSPIAINDYFQKEGYTTHTTTSTKASDLEKVANQSDVLIVTLYNDKEDITAAVHTMCITKDENGQYILHNSNIINSKGEYVARTGYNSGDSDGYNSIQEVLDNYGNCESIMLIGIEDKPEPIMGDFPEPDPNGPMYC